MEITVSTQQGKVPVTVVQPHGDVDASNYAELVKKVETLHKDGVQDFLIDLSDVPYMSSAGLVALHSIAIIMRGEKPADPITLFVYTGADAAFTIYEDDGLTYGYERGAAARIPIQWNETARTLTIGQREGSFPGMLTERTFQIVVVAKTKPVGFASTPAVDQTVHYRGEAIQVKIP